MQKQTFGILIGTRGFFNAKLVSGVRERLLKKLDEKGYGHVILPSDQTPTGAVESPDDARICANLFRAHADQIDGVLVILPNFGDEIAIAETLRQSGLNKPVLVQATPDELDKLSVATRRDAFCGKIAVCNNLVQYGIPFSLTGTHTSSVDGESFLRDLDWFAAVCRVVNGLKGSRIGAIGARPGAFQTMRYSEKILLHGGITVTTVDLSEILAAAKAVDPRSAAVTGKIKEIREYGSIPGSVQAEALEKQAALSLALDQWISRNRVQAAAVLCWQSVQFNYGCAACLAMSMSSEKGIPCACETDVCGAISMLALQLASGRPAGLFDWNNNYADDAEKCVAQHCSSFPKNLIGGPVSIGCLDVMSNNIGEEYCFGAVKGKALAGPMTFLRVTTDDRKGKITSYVGDAEFTDDPFGMNGGIAVMKIKNLQNLLKIICREGFEHHAALTRTHCAPAIREAFTRYLQWNILPEA